MITLIGIAVLIASAFVVLGGLRMVAQDTYETLFTAASNARADGVLLQRVSFVALWVIIFSLSYF